MGYLRPAVERLQRTLLNHAHMTAATAVGFLFGLLVAASAGWAGADIDALKLVAVIVGSILGAALGIIGARALSHSNDVRDTRRKINSAVYQLDLVTTRMVGIRLQIEKLAKIEGATPEERARKLDPIMSLGIARLELQQAVAAAPSFDGFLDDDEDNRHARNTVEALRSLRMVLGYEMWNFGMDAEPLYRFAQGLVDPYALVNFTQWENDLSAAGLHFAVKSRLLAKH